jgi:hypothetical protein
MRRCLFALMTTLSLSAAAAPAADPASAPACRSALEALQRREDAALAAPGRAATATDHEGPAAGPELLALQHAAATACLGGADSRLAQRLAIPPVGMTPITVGPARPTRPATGAPAATESPPVRQAAPLATLTACDATGCWASDGTRLQRAGATLLGPRGVCSRAGGVLHCP